MKHLGYIADADSILLWFPSQNRTVSEPKTYGFGTENVRFWDGERTVLGRRTYGFGTENVKRRLLETDSIPFGHTLAHSLPNNCIR